MSRQEPAGRSPPTRPGRTRPQRAQLHLPHTIPWTNIDQDGTGASRHLARASVTKPRRFPQVEAAHQILVPGFSSALPSLIATPTTDSGMPQRFAGCPGGCSQRELYAEQDCQQGERCDRGTPAQRTLYSATAFTATTLASLKGNPEGLFNLTDAMSCAGFDGHHQATEDQGWQHHGSTRRSFGSERSG